MSPLNARTATLGSAGGIGRRRPDPTPWGWEVPTAGLLAWLCVAGAGLLAAQAVAAWLTGHGWLWPDSPHLFPALGGLLTGHLGTGLDTPDGLPSPAPVVAAAVVIEVALLVVTVWAARWFWTTAGPGRRLGMATRADAETALGAGRLRRVRKLIRPDLYGPASHRHRTPRLLSLHRRRAQAPAAGRRQPADTASVADAVDAGIAAARVNRVRFGRPTSQREGGPSEGPVHQAIVLTDLAGDAGRQSHSRFSPAQVGWRLGSGAVPRTGDLWVPFDRTTGVYGPQGSGKTLDLLTPALLSAPGAALVTLTKAEDLLLTVDHRAAGSDGQPGGRPVAVLDPFGLAPGLPELVWDPVDGCVDSMVAERRAKAFTAGTVRGAVAQGSGDSAARFYAAEGAKVLQAYFHAAALTGRSIEDVLEWVANPRGATTPEEILRTHPHAAPFWHGLLHGALHGDDRTAGNTTTTVQQAMALFFQASLRARCTPGPGPAGHRPGRPHRPRRDHLPARPGRPVRVRVPADDRDRRARPGHRPAGCQRVPVRPAVPAVPGLPRRAALHRAAADAADPDGQRTSPGSVVHLRRADLAAAGHLLRRGRGPRPVRADQRHRRLRRQQGRPVQPGAVRPDRHLEGLPDHLQPRPRVQRIRGHLARRRRRTDPAARRRSGCYRSGTPWSSPRTPNPSSPG